MGLNNGESIDVNVLARYLAPGCDPHRSERPTDEEARDALARLTDKAHKHFMAGAAGRGVLEHWTRDRS